MITRASKARKFGKTTLLLVLGLVGLIQLASAADNSTTIDYTITSAVNQSVDDSRLPSYLKNEKSNNTCLVCLI